MMISSSANFRFRSNIMLLCASIFLFVATTTNLFVVVDAAVSCDCSIENGDDILCVSDPDDYCEWKNRKGSYCHPETKTCTNPFANGCLKAMLDADNFVGDDAAGSFRWKLGRVCNSDDSNENGASNGDGDASDDEDESDDIVSELGCYLEQQFNYTEIRIHHSNWESSIFYAWILQIILSEILHVPATIGYSKDHTYDASFYNLNSNVAYSASAYPWEAIKNANEIIDCRKFEVEDGSGEEFCAHVMPEVWNGQEITWTQANRDGIIDTPEGNGMVGKISFYVPGFVARNDSTLVSFYGLQGNENRRKLASTFNRPTTWYEYCELISPDKCGTAEAEAQVEGGESEIVINMGAVANNATTNATIDDITDAITSEAPEDEDMENGGPVDRIAKRYPQSDSEKAAYYVAGLYKGHFRPTDANDCDLNPETCTGHIVAPPCTWSTFLEAQIYWNDIALESNGPDLPTNSYSYGSMIQVWKAAVETQSPVIFWWYKPDPTLEEFRNTNGEFQQVLLPDATDLCTDHRISSEARCSLDIWERRGDELGSCDSEGKH